MVERPGRKRLQRVGADAELCSRQRLGRIHRVDAQPGRQSAGRDEIARFQLSKTPIASPFADIENRARLESLFGKIGCRIDDHLPAIPLGTRDPPHDHHVVPLQPNAQSNPCNPLDIPDFERDFLARPLARHRRDRSHRLNRPALPSDQLADVRRRRRSPRSASCRDVRSPSPTLSAAHRRAPSRRSR